MLKIGGSECGRGCGVGGELEGQIILRMVFFMQDSTHALFIGVEFITFF